MKTFKQFLWALLLIEMLIFWQLAAFQPWVYMLNYVFPPLGTEFGIWA